MASKSGAAGALIEVVVQFKSSASSAIRKASIDHVSLTFVGDVAHLDVSPGEHALTWYIYPPEATTYTIAITKPPEAKFDHSVTLAAGEKDGGIHWFTVNA